MTELLTNPDTYFSLITLTALEIVLGIDNLLFVSLVANELPKQYREKARKIGLSLALFGRIALLLSLTWLMKFTEPLFELFGHNFSGRDIIFFFGGIFLIYKSTQEIFNHLEHPDSEIKIKKTLSFSAAIFQILLLDIVFSLDSIITAIGLAQHVGIMIVAITISLFIMLFFSQKIGHLIELHPSMKVLGLAFLLTVAVLLVVESFGQHVPRGYIYFALAFSLCVELVNIRHRAVKK